ncbi:MAG: anaerobic ribonucleoside-triphosphate reductase activating protein [Thermoguttaceae bacterium]|nr:anaerobic ribonucleoside-triphosphate reductase activating protein [Thermoguttaceae bacterium]
MKLRIAGCVADSIVDGPGIRYALFTQGCPRSCKGCHNPQSHDPNGGVETTTEQILQEIDSNPLLDGVTFSGGEPFMQAGPLAQLARDCRLRGLNIVVYTGYKWEELIEANNDDWKALLKETDALVDGPFIQELRDWKLKFMGSSNQRIIDVPRSLAQNRIVQLDGLEHMPPKIEQ